MQKTYGNEAEIKTPFRYIANQLKQDQPREH